MWPVTIYIIPSIPSPSEGEAQLTGTGCTGELWHAKARRDVFAVFSRVETLLVRSVTGEEARRGRVGRDSVKEEEEEEFTRQSQYKKSTKTLQHPIADPSAQPPAASAAAITCTVDPAKAA
jgi:hypothetical protein